MAFIMRKKIFLDESKVGKIFKKFVSLVLIKTLLLHSCAQAVCVHVNPQSLIPYSTDNRLIHVIPFEITVSRDETQIVDVAFDESLQGFKGQIALFDQIKNRTIADIYFEDPSQEADCIIKPYEPIHFILNPWMNQQKLAIISDQAIELTIPNSLTALYLKSSQLSLKSPLHIINNLSAHVGTWIIDQKVQVGGALALSGNIQNKNELLCYGQMTQYEGSFTNHKNGTLFVEKELGFKGTEFSMGGKLILSKESEIHARRVFCEKGGSLYSHFLKINSSGIFDIQPTFSFNLGGGLFKSQGHLNFNGNFTFGNVPEDQYISFFTHFLTNSDERKRCNNIRRQVAPMQGLVVQAHSITGRPNMVTPFPIAYDGNSIELHTRVYGFGSADVLFKGVLGKITGSFTNTKTVKALFEKSFKCTPA